MSLNQIDVFNIKAHKDNLFALTSNIITVPIAYLHTLSPKVTSFATISDGLTLSVFNKCNTKSQIVLKTTHLQFNSLIQENK